ncbi:MAG: hypothetical protein M3O28_06855 [Actinomycetota bacterium]|nr:hypothetical protein [Actinomycetota bacterium]
MDLAAALATDLTALSRALDEPDAGLETQLQTLTADLERAVDSYLGLAITINLDGRQLGFTTYIKDEASSQIASSLLLPLTALTAVSSMQAGSTLVFYAAPPGAFVDLAADLSFALGLDVSDVVLDQHLTTPVAGDGFDGLQSWSDINQAIGVLIGQGHTPDAAHVELRRLAALDSGSLHHAAAVVLSSAIDPAVGDSDVPMSPS